MRSLVILTTIIGFSACHQAPANQTTLLDTVSPSASFKLYDEVDARINTECDLYTQLDLDTAALTAKLVNRLAGTCEIALFPDPRSYNLTATTDDCGAVIFSGKNPDWTLEITDNRKNTCEMVLPALIVVKEESEAGTRMFYSNDRDASPAASPAKFYCDGVGGTDEWTIYVDLNKKLAGFFDNDTTVVIPMTDYKSLESNPPQDLYTFEGADTGGGDGEKLRIYFNKTKLSGSLILSLGTADEETLTAENICVADDSIDLDDL